MKRILPALLSLATVMAVAQSTQGQFAYVTNNGTIAITGYTGSDGTVTIPDLINGLPVTTIENTFPDNLTGGGGAFAYNLTVTNIVLGSHMMDIGSGAFAPCAGLLEISVDTANPWYASAAGVLFNKSLTTLVEFPPHWVGSYGIPGSVTSIAIGAFAASGLTGVTIPNSVTNIGGGAFYECRLTNVTIPDSVTCIAHDTFNLCKLLSVTIPDSVTSIGDDAFYDCLFLPSVTIPNSVTNLGIGAFEDCFSMTNVTIGNGIARIGDEAFSYCANLTTLQIPDSVTDIGSGAFFRSGLESVSFGANVTLIEDGAFSDCESLSSMPTLTGVTSIGYGGFEECGSLTNITFGSNLTAIGGVAFFGSGLTQVTIPGSVTNLGGAAFDFCDQLRSIMVDAANPVCSAVAGVLFDKTRTTLLQYPAGLFGSYAIPHGTVCIGMDAFGGCDGLTDVTLPNSVTSIERLAFDDCKNLTNVTVGSGVTNLGSYAFYADRNLRRLYFQGNAPGEDGTEFEGVGDLGGNTNATVYYLPGTLGWGPTYGFLPTAPWYLPKPLILAQGTGVGIHNNLFGFTISWATNAPVVVEASTTLSPPVWLPVATNTLTAGSTYFSDPQWTNYPARFYRLYSP